MAVTKQINKIILQDDAMMQVITAEVYRKIKRIIKNKYTNLLENFLNCEWSTFSYKKQKGFYNSKLKIAVPVLEEYKIVEKSYFDIESRLPTLKEAEKLFNENCPDEIVNVIIKSKKYNKKHWIGFENGSYCFETERIADWNDGDSVHVGVVHIENFEYKKRILSGEYKLYSEYLLSKLISIIKERDVSELNGDEFNEVMTLLQIDCEKIYADVYNKFSKECTLSNDLAETFINELLECDTRRADLEKYDRKCLEDVNSGHWELWNVIKSPDIKKTHIEATLSTPLVARNPIADIHEDGLIGIDFGTKSTIVSRQDGREKTTLLRVGIGQLCKSAEASHYENPTIIEFCNLEKFLENYVAAEGRPETSINDLRVSHAADNDLKSCDKSDEFYSFFYDIKQWCGDTERNIKLIDQKGVERVLPAFVKLEKGDFNPLEIYAYYLGLYINNMRNGIYIDYVLSFPVTYEKAVKQKILESFTVGLRKSLPEPVLADKEAMSRFRVRQGVSEPAAYAITALQEYGFEPDNNERILYSIFDFGGGTTDFDFGVWRCAGDNREEERYDYVIEHFGSEGDKYLGGENLLELMAFEIFKSNAMFLQKGKSKKSDKTEEGFSFSKPIECEDFPGSEMLVSNSQEARRNTKQLMEALRPFWEGIIGIADSQKKTSGNEIIYNGYVFKNSQIVSDIAQDGRITVDLFDKCGNLKQGQILYVCNKEANINVNLVEILENRIERGVRSFFDSVKLALDNKTAKNSGVNEIQIFLAGNSSKSPILKKLFGKYITEVNDKITAESKIDGEHFQLFPPLGTVEAFEIQKKRGVKVNEGDITAPTGKTGVAYGLIAGREGGTIKVISEITSENEAKFRYTLGKARRGKFSIVVERNDIEYNNWIRFIDAREEDFEIYYSSIPGVGQMPVDETGIYKKRCRLEEINEEADVYIRAVSPVEVEYTMSKGVPSGKTKVKKVRLGE